MRPRIIKEINRIAGSRLTNAQREEIADCAVRIMEDINKAKALQAIETIKEKIGSVSDEVLKAAKEKD